MILSFHFIRNGFTILVTGDEKHIYTEFLEYLHSQPTTGVMRVRSM